jgi:hypothetical protein
VRVPLLASALLSAGCSFSGLGAATTDGATRLDAPSTDGRTTDAVLADGPAAVCVGSGTGLIRPCQPSAPAPGLVTIAPGVFNTDSDPRCLTLAQDGGPAACLVWATDLSVPTTTIVIGSRPLILAATATITVGGTLDASSTRADVDLAAGANPTQCGALIPPTADSGGGAGAAGGTMGTIGGDGGTGDGNDNGPPAGKAPPGRAAAVTPVAVVRGGCAGGVGASDLNGHSGGKGGNGGGAIYLVAGTSITVTGGLFASGAAGGGGAIEAGGGGGGAGGLIGLDAPTLGLAGVLIAHGGGGGSGGGATAGPDGTDGTIALVVPRGGIGLPMAGDGGDGAYSTAIMAFPATAGGVDNGGGGGGGGGAGIIVLRGTRTGTPTISPAPI